MSSTRQYGARRDVHDVRDRMYRMAAPQVLPKYVDLSAWAGPIKDQGSEGSCTGHAYSSLREWIARKYEKSSVVLSPQFLYSEELIKEGVFPQDRGAMPRTGCQVLTEFGCCEAVEYPYVAGHITLPTPDQVANALKYRTGAYHRIASLTDVMACLSDTTPWPVSVGFTVYQSFESAQVADTGIMPIPSDKEVILGGHEVLCLGYDADKRLAKIQNSWGNSWGQHGFFWMPFEVLESPSTDLWMAHIGGPWSPR